MIKTACILAVTLFASGLCIAPFAMAAPVKEKRMRLCNKAASKMGAEEREDFLKECLSTMPMAASDYEHKDPLSKREKFCNKASSKMDAEERGDFLTECLSVEPPKAEGMQ